MDRHKCTLRHCAIEWLRFFSGQVSFARPDTAEAQALRPAPEPSVLNQNMREILVFLSHVLMQNAFTSHMQ